jgi:hypothetical protein
MGTLFRLLMTLRTIGKATTRRRADTVEIARFIEMLASAAFLAEMNAQDAEP